MNHPVSVGTRYGIQFHSASGILSRSVNPFVVFIALPRSVTRPTAIVLVERVALCTSSQWPSSHVEDDGLRV